MLLGFGPAFCFRFTYGLWNPGKCLRYDLIISMLVRSWACRGLGSVAAGNPMRHSRLLCSFSCWICPQKCAATCHMVFCSLPSRRSHGPPVVATHVSRKSRVYSCCGSRSCSCSSNCCWLQLQRQLQPTTTTAATTTCSHNYRFRYNYNFHYNCNYNYSCNYNCSCNGDR